MCILSGGYTLSISHPLCQSAWSHLFEVILPPLVTVGDVQGVQVFQGTSVISEGHLGYPLQDLVKLLLTLSLEKSKNNNTGQVHGPVSPHLGVLESPGLCDSRVKCNWPVAKTVLYKFSNLSAEK